MLERGRDSSSHQLSTFEQTLTKVSSEFFSSRHQGYFHIFITVIGYFVATQNASNPTYPASMR